MQTFKSPDGNDDRKTLVDEGTELNGTLKSTCPVVVRGKVEGEVTAPAIDISSSGAVHGRMKAGTFVSAGDISGEVEADSVQLSGNVKDKTTIRAKTLDVKIGTTGPKSETRFGECVLEVGTIPSKEAVIAACLSGGVRNGDAAPKADTARDEKKPQGEPAGDSATPTTVRPEAPAEPSTASAPSVPEARKSDEGPVDDEGSRKEKASATADPGAAIMSALSDASADPEPAPPSMLARAADGAARKVVPKRV